MSETQSTPASLPPDVAPVVASLLRELDQAMPDQIRGLYLVGSLALADYRSGQSDIGFIAVTEANADMLPLAGVHKTLAETYPAVSCDGIYFGTAS